MKVENLLEDDHLRDQVDGMITWMDGRWMKVAQEYVQ
jgi:hypothetical protein